MNDWCGCFNYFNCCNYWSYSNTSRSSSDTHTYNSTGSLDYPMLVLGSNATSATPSAPPMMVTYPQPSVGIMHNNPYASSSSYYNNQMVPTVQVISSYPAVSSTPYQQEPTYPASCSYPKFDV